MQVDSLQVQITRQLRKGGYAFIYEAKDVAIDKVYALKRFFVEKRTKLVKLGRGSHIFKSNSSFLNLRYIYYAETIQKRTKAS